MFVHFLQRSADRVAKRLRAKAYLAGGVRIKLKTSTFRLLTRQCTVAPTNLAADLFSAAEQLLDAVDDPGPFRLVGLGAYELEKRPEVRQLDLFDAPRQSALEGVMDAVNARFGDGSVHRARDTGSKTIMDEGVNLDFAEGSEEEGEDAV